MVELISITIDVKFDVVSCVTAMCKACAVFCVSVLAIILRFVTLMLAEPLSVLVCTAIAIIFSCLLAL